MALIESKAGFPATPEQARPGARRLRILGGERNSCHQWPKSLRKVGVRPVGNAPGGAGDNYLR
jgi:hypothetical protein